MHAHVQPKPVVVVMHMTVLSLRLHLANVANGCLASWVPRVKGPATLRPLRSDFELLRLLDTYGKSSAWQVKALKR